MTCDLMELDTTGSLAGGGMAFVIWSMGMGRHICRESSVFTFQWMGVCTVFVPDMMGNLDSLASYQDVSGEKCPYVYDTSNH